MRKILGAGFSCIDIVKNNNREIIQNGGTCANVLSLLSVLGWECTLLKAHYEDLVNTVVDDNLSSLGVKTIDFKHSLKAMPRILQISNMDHQFMTSCPKCGNRLINLELPTKTNISKTIDDFSQFDFFYHDRISAGIDHVVDLMHRNGNLVIYEPNSARNGAALIMHSLMCDIVKFSTERIPMKYADLIRNSASSSKTKLLICTNGKKGLSFSYLNHSGVMSEWTTILPFATKKIVDTSGAGDWMTAGFLFSLFSSDADISEGLSEEKIVKALEKARDYAKRCCQYQGAQGAYYDSTFMSKMDKEPLIHPRRVDWPITTCGMCHT